MVSPGQYSKDLVIKNPLGFHVRPVQRFAELAGMFCADIEVAIDGQKGSGKSTMALVSLGGQYGSRMRITASGQDARQALDVLSYLVEQNFFVEESLDVAACSERHVTRLAKFASCFESNVQVTFGGKKVDARDRAALLLLGFSPTSKVGFVIEGTDHKQARDVLNKLISYQFYVEEAMSARPQRKAK